MKYVAWALALAGVLAWGGAAQGAAYNWATAISGNWSDTSITGWNAAGYPSAVGDIATFNLNIASDTTVTIDVANATIGGTGASAGLAGLWLQDATTADRNWIIASSAPGNSLTVDATGTATVTMYSATGSNTISAPIVLNDKLSVTVTGQLTFSGPISGAAANTLTKAGAGVLALTASNSFSGGVTLSAGTLALGDDNALGTGTLDLSTANTIGLRATDATARAISCPVKLGDRTLAVGAAGTGSIALNGTVTLSAATSSNAINGLSTLTINGKLTSTATGGISFTGGTLVLANTANDFTGRLVVGQTGTIVFNDARQLGNASGIYLGNASNDNSVPGTATLRYTGSGEAISKPINLNYKNSTAKVALEGSGTGAVVYSGSIAVTYNNGPNSNSGFLNQTLYLGGSSALSVPNEIQGVIPELVFPSPTGNPGLYKTAVTLRDANTWVLSGSNTYTGDTTLSGAGRLVLGNAKAVQNSTLICSNGSLGFAGSIGTFTLGALSGSVNQTLQDSASTNVSLTVGGNGASTTYSGALSAGNNFTKTGSGSLTLTNNDSWSGATTITGGSVQLAGTLGALPSTSGIAVSGATLNVGDATLANNNGVTNRINPAATLTLGGTSGSGTFNLYNASSGAHSQTLAALAAGAGDDIVQIPAGGSNAATLTFSGAAATVYTRAPNATVSFLPNSSTISFTNAPTGSGVVGSGDNAILAGAVLSGANFVKAASGAVGAATYTANTWSSGTNTDLTGDLSPSGDTQSVRFNDATLRTVTLSGTSTIESGGILVTAAATAGGRITGGTLLAPAGNDLWVYAANTLTVDSALADNSTSGLSKSGSGTLVLTANETYAGPTYINQGTLQLGTGGATGSLGGNANLYIGSGGTLALNRTGIYNWTGNIKGAGAVVNASAAGSLNLTLSGANTLGALLNSGTATLNGTGTTQFLAGSQLRNTTDGAVMNITGGTWTTPQMGASGILPTRGTWNISGGVLNVLSNVGAGGANGTFNVNGGTVNYFNGFSIANGSDCGGGITYNLSNGLVDVGHFGGSAYFGGTAGYNAYWSQTGGTLQIGMTGTGPNNVEAFWLGGGANTLCDFSLSGGKIILTGAMNWSAVSGTGANTLRLTGGTVAVGVFNNVNNLNATLTITNSGATMAPGDVGIPGFMRIYGNYNGVGGALYFDIGGASAASSIIFQAPGANYDVLNLSSGSGTMAGKLVLNLINGYVPANTTNFDVVTAGTTLTGSFTNTVLTGTDYRVIATDGLSSFTVVVDGTNKRVRASGYKLNEWQGASGANWSTLSSWTAMDPNGSDYIARFGTLAVSAGTAVLDAARTVRGLQFNNINPYTLTGTSTLTLNNGTSPAAVDVQAGSHTVAVPVSLASNTTVSATGNLTLSNDVSGAGGLTKAGSGTLALGGSNSYFGDTTVLAGVLQVNSTTLGGGESALNFYGGTLRFGNAGFDPSAGPGGARSVAMFGNTIFDTAGLDATVANRLGYAGTDANGVAGTTGGLIKTGSGKLTLQGSNIYTGGTTVNAGTLQVDNAAALPAGRNLTISSGGSVVLSSGLSQAISLGGLTITSGAGGLGELGQAPSAAAGGPTAGGGPVAGPVPEPGTALLLAAAALAGMTLLRRKRKGPAA